MERVGVTLARQAGMASTIRLSYGVMLALGLTRRSSDSARRTTGTRCSPRSVNVR